MKGDFMVHNRHDGHHPKQQFLIQPNIGLDSDVRHSVVEILNITLANEAVLTVKTRSAHWNVSGAGFFELYILFNSQYKQLNDISDEIAERARMLGGIAIGSLQEFIDYTRVEEQPGIVPDILHLIADHEACIRFLREDARKCTEDYEDEGTFELLVSVMRLHEKMAWMLRSYIENEPIHGESRKGFYEMKDQDGLSPVTKELEKLNDDARGILVGATARVKQDMGHRLNQYNSSFFRRKTMNTDVFEGRWKQMRGQAKVWWGKLTDDDLETVSGKFDRLIGLLQVKYGYTKQQAEEEYQKRTHEQL
jgi:starvation-inducible DNA-binding protein